MSNSDTELELDEAFEAKQSDQAFGQNSDDHHDPGHFEKHSTMQSSENNSSTAAAQKAENTVAFTINLDDNNELPRSLESAERNLESPQRSLLEEAEAVVARLRPACSPYQASFPLHNNHMDGD